MRPIALLCLAAAACGVQLDDRTGASTDVPGGTPVDGGTPGTDAAPRCASRQVYLNFEGQTLTRGSPSDATQNRAAWMNVAQGTAPRYLANATDRDAQIKSIVDGVTAQLSSFPIRVVTQRPAAGPYVMIVFGGVANQVGSNYGAAVNQLDCGDNAKSDLAWISDNVTPPQRVVNSAVGAIGFGLGLTATTDPLDCMCGWANNCTSNNTVACKLSPMINRDPNANQRCQGVTTQNEMDAFETAFCR
jgi:hypothetical protein